MNRDEVLAEWCFASNGCATLHVYCHVSGEERWLAPPALRNYIFQREMPLVGFWPFLMQDIQDSGSHAQLKPYSTYIVAEFARI